MAGTTQRGRAPLADDGDIVGNFVRHAAMAIEHISSTSPRETAGYVEQAGGVHLSHPGSVTQVVKPAEGFIEQIPANNGRVVLFVLNYMVDFAPPLVGGFE